MVHGFSRRQGACLAGVDVSCPTLHAARVSGWQGARREHCRRHVTDAATPPGGRLARKPRSVLKNDVARFSERGAQLARRDEGAGRRPVTEEATPPDGMPRSENLEVDYFAGAPMLLHDGSTEPFAEIHLGLGAAI